MNIIISLAKKVSIREGESDLAGLPCFLSRAEILEKYVRSLSREEVRNMWACNERIAALNYERFRDMNLTSRLTPALLSYEGIQYQYIAPGVFGQKSWGYVQPHLRILSGFYGILCPPGGIVSYRLGMQVKMVLSLKEEGQKRITSLCEYRGDLLYRKLVKEGRTIINLASKEYSKAIESYLTSDTTYITCVFGSLERGKQGNAKVKIKATEARMTRREMVRSMVENAAEEPGGVKAFGWLGYRCNKVLPGEQEYVFLKQQGIRMGEKDKHLHFIGDSFVSGD